MGTPDIGLETLLDLDGSILEQEGGYWIKIEARRVPSSEHAMHGIRYSLTLHDKYGIRVLGYDNAHAVKPPKKVQVRRAAPALRSSPPDLKRQGRALRVRIGASALGGFLRRG